MGNQMATNIVNSAVYAGLSVDTSIYQKCSDTANQSNIINIANSNNIDIQNFIQNNYLVFQTTCYAQQYSSGNFSTKIESAVVDSIQQQIKGITGGEVGKNITDQATTLADAMATSLGQTCTASTNQSNVLNIVSSENIDLYASKQTNITNSNLSCMASQTAIVQAYTTLINSVENVIKQKSTGFLTSLVDAVLGAAKELVLAVIIIIGLIIGFVIVAIVGGFKFLSHPSGFLALILAAVALFALFMIIAYIFSWFPYSSALFGLSTDRNRTILIISIIVFVVSLLGLIVIGKSIKEPKHSEDLNYALAGSPVGVYTSPTGQASEAVNSLVPLVIQLRNLKKTVAGETGSSKKETEKKIKAEEKAIEEQEKSIPKAERERDLQEADQIAVQNTS